MPNLFQPAGGDPANQPAYGSQRYKRQVETITTVACEAETKEVADQLVMMYVLDLSYHRAAICEAMSAIDKHFKQSEHTA